MGGSVALKIADNVNLKFVWGALTEAILFFSLISLSSSTRLATLSCVYRGKYLRLALHVGVCPLSVLVEPQFQIVVWTVCVWVRQTATNFGNPRLELHSTHQRPEDVVAQTTFRQPSSQNLWTTRSFSSPSIALAIRMLSLG